MSLLQWQDRFRIGIAEVDLEHRELIELINALHGELGGDRTPARVEEFLGEILARITAHFALEEKSMETLGYPERAAHKADHERLLDDIRDIMDEVDASGVLDEARFSARLSDWFGVHFASFDERLHRYLVTRPAGRPR
ncbi:MAG: bacteriohemerythrin [Steroidobacteraceae bacterium]